MAIVKLKDVKVSFVNRSGSGFKVTEESESRGKTYKQQYTVWPESHSLKVGDVISVSGLLGAKIGEPWTDREGNERTSVELSINSPRIDATTSSVPASQVADEAWATPAEYTEEAPF